MLLVIPEASTVSLATQGLGTTDTDLGFRDR